MNEILTEWERVTGAYKAFPFSSVTVNGVRAWLLRRIAETGTAQEWAKANGLSPQYVSDVLGGRREPGRKILSALGLRRVTVYQQVVSDVTANTATTDCGQP